jgi:predicted phage terminase large subunit-like protein
MSAVIASELDLSSAVARGAEDPIFYSEFFFPRAIRQLSPPFHQAVWEVMTNSRMSSFKIFRGGAKTTLARIFTSRRIAYGMGHTILFISKSEDHAVESVVWLQEQVEFNDLFAAAFNLAPGRKWTGSDIEIVHRIEDYTIRVKALGILGSVRGINVKDYRPDTIVVDDPCDEENTATAEGRQKMGEIFFGAVKESLAPASEDPNACLTLLQTPLAEDDLCDMCEKSDDFATLRVGILDKDDDESNAESTWPARWSKEEILKDKRNAEARNQLSLWAREKQCLIIGRESSDFKEEWLQYWEILPPEAIYVGAIDPAPILSETARLRAAKGDFQAIAVCAFWRGKKYVVEYVAARDQDPDMVVRELQRLNRKYRIRAWGVETVAYQQTLKWYIEKQIKAGVLQAVRIVEVKAVKDKATRIRQAHSERAFAGKLYVHRTHVEYINQYKNHPNSGKKDIIDAVSMCDYVVTPGMETGFDITHDESQYESLPSPGACP